MSYTIDDLARRAVGNILLSAPYRGKLLCASCFVKLLMPALETDQESRVRRAVEYAFASPGALQRSETGQCVQCGTTTGCLGAR